MEQKITIGAAEKKLQLKIEKQMMPYVSAAGEKTFVLSEDLSLPEGCEPIKELLLTRLESRAEETQSVAGKLLLRGNSTLELLYLNEEGTLSNPRRLTMQWSQLLDVGQEAVQCRVILMPTALYVDRGLDGSGVSVELHLTAQALCLSERELCYVSDAYSIAGDTELRWEELTAEENAAWILREENLRDSYAVATGTERVLQSYAEIGKRYAGGYGIRCHSLLLSSDGSVSSVERELAFEGKQLPELLQCTTEISGGKLESTVSLLTEEEGQKKEPLRFVAELSVEGENARRKSSRSELFIVRSDGAVLWDIAKKYRSTIDLIEQANRNREEKDRFLFVPEAR